MTSAKSLNRIFWVIPYWFKTLDCEIWSTNTKSCFWESEEKLQTLQKLSPYISFSHKFVVKPVKSLNRIFWAMQYCFRTLECRIWSTNTKPFLWESEGKLETLLKLSLYIGVYYKIVLKFVKTLSRIFWVMEYWLKDWECQIWLTIAQPFFWESEQSLKLSKNFLRILGFCINFFWSLWKS